MKDKVLVILIVVFAALSGMLGGLLLSGSRRAGSALMQEELSTLGKYDQVLHYIRSNYVDSINADSINDLTLMRLMSELDPHSAYIPAKDLDDVNTELGSSFSGIGIQFVIRRDTVHVVEVVSGGPSERAGIKAGDRIVTVDDSLFVGRTVTNERVMHTLRGKKGSTVRLGIAREGAAESLTFTITRGDIPPHAIDAAFIIRPGVGMIRVSKFSETTYTEFLNALASLRNQGARNYVIDLRENGGGLMDQVIYMANEFLRRGQTIVYSEGRSYERFDAIADGTGRFKNAPLAVLIDEYSASASEIFAGAMQDNDRGIVVGRRSFGKGLVQQQYELTDHSAIRLTVARYYTPSGRCIQKPYRLGEQDDYLYDLWNRYEHGELDNRDSIRMQDSTVYKTIGGRTVYGGGGIMPDVFVPRDTSRYTAWYNLVSNRSYTIDFAFQYVDQNRARLSEYTDYQSLEQYLLRQDLVNRFVAYADERGVEPNRQQIDKSAPLLLQHLVAYIIRDALGNEAFFQIWLRDDTMVQRAIEALQTEHLPGSVSSGL